MSHSPVAPAPAITGPFANVLRAGRDQFNARFAEARRMRPQLDETAFGLHLMDNVAPIVNAVALAKPGAASAVAQVAYDLSLELVGQCLVGLSAPDPLPSRAWRELAPNAVVHVATQPRKVLGALTNAALHFRDYPGARGNEWLKRMCEVVPLAATFDDVLRAGQVIAWQCGLAHFRAGALDAAEALRADLALAALGVDAASADKRLRDPEVVRDGVVAALRADRWLRLSTAGTDGLDHARPNRIAVVGRAGGFRGFGGPFVTPPLVAADGERLFARSDNGCWLITADAYGAVFHRAAPHEFDRAREVAARQAKPFTLVRGRVGYGTLSSELAEIASVTSIAQAGTTLAVTTALSHAVVLVAAVG